MTEAALSERAGRDRELLATLAAPLGPARAPEYLRRHPRLPDGWYWICAGETQWRYLGRNAQGAAARLVELLSPRALG